MVKLKDVVETLEMTGENWTSVLNRKTGEILTISEEVLTFLDDDLNSDDLPEWQREDLPKIKEALDSDDWLALPDRFEIDEWSIIQRFVWSVQDEEQREKLSYLIQGRGAFRRFKDAIHEMGIQDKWYRYHDEELNQIAIDWLEENGIAYE